MLRSGSAAIRIADLLRMSSGLRFVAPQDSDFDPSRGYPLIPDADVMSVHMKNYAREHRLFEPRCAVLLCV
jgi:CubicO group peptidase (beta-lactamase class C family)